MVAAIWIRGALQATRHFPCRSFHQLRRGQSKEFLQSSLKWGRTFPKRGCFHPGVTNIARNTIKASGNKEKMTGRDMLKVMIDYVWPKSNPGVRVRVTFALSLLIGAKLLNVAVPFLFKDIIDTLNKATGSQLNMSDPNHVIGTFIIALVVPYGLARTGAAGFNELRNAVFAKVAQHSIRRIAQNVFRHLHSLDLSFHLNRQTGALSKAIDRGSRGIATVLNAMVFNIVPTVFEVILVSGFLAYNGGPQFSMVALGAVGMYSVWTLGITRWRTQFRLDMNKAENEAGNKAIDSLINYETVKYFNNEDFEAKEYDKSLLNYEKASMKTSRSLALLNFGQNVIFSGAMTGVMLLAADQIMKGQMTGEIIERYIVFMEIHSFILTYSRRPGDGQWVTLPIVNPTEFLRICL